MTLKAKNETHNKGQVRMQDIQQPKEHGRSPTHEDWLPKQGNKKQETK
jgi:hypothetical protein